MLNKCLQHLALQTNPPEHVYIVDNASSDGSDRIALKQISSKISIIKNSQNIGFAAGNNRALEKCNTQFVALLNPDAFPAPDWLEHLLKASNRYPDAAAFGSRQLCEKDTDIIDGIGDIYHVSGLVWRKRHGFRQETEDLAEQEIFSACAAAAMYRYQALKKVGGFDEDFFCYLEDVDLGFRLRLSGYKAVYVPDAVVRHVGSALTGGQHSSFSIYHGHRNILWTYVKNMPGILFWLLLPLHLFMNLGTLFVYSFRRKGRIIFRSKLDAIRGFPKMWIKRKHIQKHRIASTKDIFKILHFCLKPKKKY